ncbi:unnamed protein product [Hyaloperonospora brassicae]|uniref:Coiled-coil domain-containing protein 22 homolog n=1 Tax=Hyaloperonospora brassicae TaxID=162125 RepID=A0AAV0TBG9_HYABA|nr:unnamed protein product [Hyaloperonospora brassicae]
MAEADALIVAALQQSDIVPACARESASWTVSDLTSDEFLALMHKCLTQLKKANNGARFTLPSIDAVAPTAVAAKHRVGLTIANILKELGYGGDCSYHHFLYPSAKETRKILTWIVSKLPKTEHEDVKEEDMKQGHASESMGRRTGDWQEGSVVGRESLRDIFSKWKREKTLYMLPHQHVEGLRGFQRLPLQTSPLELPWNRSTKSTQKLFEGFPRDSVKVTSLLEALAVEKCKTTIRLRDDELEDEGETERMDLEISQEQAGAAQRSAGDSGCLAWQETSVRSGGDGLTPPQTIIGIELPDVPISFNVSAPEPDGVCTRVSSAFESGELNSVDTSQGRQGTSADPVENNEEQLLGDTEKLVNDTKHRLAAMQKVLRRKRDELHQIEQHILETKTRGQEMQRKLARKKQLLALLPDASTKVAKLESICKRNAEKKEEAAQQMEVARQPLLKEYNELKDHVASEKARRRQLVREMKTFQTDMQTFNGIIHSKAETFQTLEKAHERQMAKHGTKEDGGGGAMTRSVYTSRIMDIIKQVHKQKQDIAKVLADIKTLQQQVEAASATKKRVAAAAEENIYSATSKSKSAKSSKADAYIECYRKFAKVRELFNELIVAVGDVSEKENAARDLQNWISQLEARESSKHLDKVLADLESVRVENVTLQNELRAHKGS